MTDWEFRKETGYTSQDQLDGDIKKVFVVLSEDSAYIFELKLNTLNDTHEVISMNAGAFTQKIQTHMYNYDPEKTVKFFTAVLKKRDNSYR